MKIHHPSAFSLTELLVSLAVLGIVAAIVIPRYINIQSQANDAVASQMADQLNSVYGSWKGSGGIVASSGVPLATAYDLLWILTGSSASPITVKNGATIVAADSLMSTDVRATVPGLPTLTDPSVSGVRPATVSAGANLISFSSGQEQFSVVSQATVNAIFQGKSPDFTASFTVTAGQSFSPQNYYSYDGTRNFSNSFSVGPNAPSNTLYASGGGHWSKIVYYSGPVSGGSYTVKIDRYNFGGSFTTLY